MHPPFLHELSALVTENRGVLIGVGIVSAASMAWGYILTRIPEPQQNKGVDESVSSGKMLWTGPVRGTGERAEGGPPVIYQPPATFDHYIIRVRPGEFITPLYAADHLHWTGDRSRALRFGFHTTAIAYAETVLGLGPGDYCIEHVAGV